MDEQNKGENKNHLAVTYSRHRHLKSRMTVKTVRYVYQWLYKISTQTLKSLSHLNSVRKVYAFLSDLLTCFGDISGYMNANQY